MDWKLGWWMWIQIRACFLLQCCPILVKAMQCFFFLSVKHHTRGRCFNLNLDTPHGLTPLISEEDCHVLYPAVWYGIVTADSSRNTYRLDNRHILAFIFHPTTFCQQASVHRDEMQALHIHLMSIFLNGNRKQKYYLWCLSTKCWIVYFESSLI
jgi:hypothetical protein